MDNKEEYLFNVQKFLDLIENINEIKLKDDIRNAYFSSLRAICNIAKFNMDSLGESGKN